MKLRNRQTVAILVLIFVLVGSLPVYGANGAEVISLEMAKEMALKNARALDTLAVTKEKLEAKVDITAESYKHTDTTTSIKSLEDAVDRANMKIAALDPADPEVDYWEDQIEIYENNITALRRGIRAVDDNTLVGLKQLYTETNNSYLDMLKTREDAEKTIGLNVEKLYFAIINADNSLVSLQKNLELVGKLLVIERLKVSLGMSLSLDEKNIAVQYNQILNSIASLKDTRKQTARQLNDLIGRPGTEELATAPVSVTPVTLPVATEELLQKAYTHSQDIAQKERAIENYKDFANDAEDSQRKVYQSDRELTEIELAGLKEEVKQKTLALVESLNNSYTAWEVAKLSKEKAELSFINVKLKYEQDLVSKLELMNNEFSYLQALYNEEKAAKDWYVAKHLLELAESGIFI